MTTQNGTVSPLAMTELQPLLEEWKERAAEEGSVSRANGATPAAPTALERELAAERARAISRWKASPEGEAKLGSLQNASLDQLRDALLSMLRSSEFSRVRDLVDEHSRASQADRSFEINSVSVG